MQELRHNHPGLWKEAQDSPLPLVFSEHVAVLIFLVINLTHYEINCLVYFIQRSRGN